MQQTDNNNQTGSDTSTSDAPPRRWYAKTDNGDWMEMLPGVKEDPLAGLGVWFMAVEAATDDEFFELADETDGELLGRVTIVDGAPVLHPAAAIAEAE